MSKVYRIKAVQKMPAGIEVAWDFFSSPMNLKHITPPKLEFTVIEPPFGEKVYPGQIIEYHIKPILGIRLYWMTEITQVKEQEYFADEQRFGPYSLWHHQHHFAIINGGVEMTDIVHYKIPFGVLGDLANTLFVKRQLRDIFNFRYRAIQQKFGKWQDAKPQITFA